MCDWTWTTTKSWGVLSAGSGIAVMRRPILRFFPLPVFPQDGACDQMWPVPVKPVKRTKMHQDAPRTTISLHSECPKRSVWVPSWSHLFQFKDPVQLFVFEVCLKALAEDINIEGIDMACHGFSKNQGSPKCQFYWEKTDQPWDPGVHISRQPNMKHLWEPEEDMGCLEMEYTLKLHKIASSIWNINDKLW